jgi:hypothetical protein
MPSVPPADEEDAAAAASVAARLRAMPGGIPSPLRGMRRRPARALAAPSGVRNRRKDPPAATPRERRRDAVSRPQGDTGREAGQHA